MDRTQARERLQQVAEWINAMQVDGRCPKCEAIGQVGGPVPTKDLPISAEDQRLLQEQPLQSLQFDHQDGCSMDEDIKNAANLLFQFRLYNSLKSVVVQTERGPVLVFRPVTEETEE